MKHKQLNDKQRDIWLAGLAEDATPDMDECVAMLGESLDWLLRLKDTPQDPEWHAEGDVHIHTHWVLQELYALFEDEAGHLKGWQRQALILGVILHDVAKPARTREMVIGDKRRIVAPQHEDVGRAYLAFKLMAWVLPFQVIWTVLQLVGEHQMPKRLIIKESPANAYWQLARQVDLELLYFLEVADMRGRSCADPQQQLLYLEEFKLFAKEYNVWGCDKTQAIKTALVSHIEPLKPSVQAYIYAQAVYQLEQGKITMAEEAIATSYTHREQHAHLVILCGPSGSGKSTFVEQHYADYALVSLDELREKLNGRRASQKNKGQIIQQAKEALRIALRQKQGVVWDATNIRRDFRAMIASLGRDYHALVTLAVFLLPEKALLEQNKQRQHRVAHCVIEKQLDRYQFPLPHEAHQYQIVGEEGKMLYQTGFYAGFYSNFLKNEGSCST
jgi:predicted kinase